MYLAIKMDIVDFENEYCNYVMVTDGFVFATGYDPKFPDFRLIRPWC